MRAMLDNIEVPAPLFISSRLMAAVRVEGAGVIHLHAVDRDEEGRVVYRYVVEDTTGKVVMRGDDYHSGALALIDYRTAMATLIDFLQADGEHYRYGHNMGTEQQCTELDGRCDLKRLEWCYQHDSQLAAARWEIVKDEEDEG